MAAYLFIQGTVTDKAHYKAFWNAPEYIDVKRLRAGAAELDIWAVQG